MEVALKRMKLKKVIILGVVILFLLSGAIILSPVEEEPDDDNGDNIVHDKTIMLIEPHPDDEILMPGTIIKHSQDGDLVYVLCIGSLDNLPPNLDKESRRQANKWFEANYLKEYIYLNYSTPFDWESIEGDLINMIELIQPERIYTFSPYGWWNHPEHKACSNMVSEVIPQLTNGVELYWFINMDQSIPFAEHKEYELYPPTISYNINWDKKLEVWEKYSDSVPDLGILLEDVYRLNDNDRKEHFRVV